MAIKRLEAIYKFLQAARDLIKSNKNIGKDEIIRFAKLEFGEVSDLLKKQIDNLFKTTKGTPSKSKIGEFFWFKNYPKTDQKKKGEVIDIKKVIDEKEGDDFIDFVRKQGDEEGANKIQKEVDRLNKAIEDADKRVAAKEALEKRTTDIASGDPTGEVSEGIESLGTNMKNLKKKVEELKKTSQDFSAEGIMKEILKSQKVMAEGYKKGNIRTAVRWFMRQEADAGRLKLSKNDYDALQVYAQTSEGDPINIFRRYYGEDALQQIDEIGDVFSKGESFNHYAQLLRENVDPSVLTPKTKGLGQYDPDVLTPKQEEELRRQLLKDQEQKQMLEDFDPTDRTKNAHGGLIDILKL